MTTGPRPTPLLEEAEEALVRAGQEILHEVELALRLPEPPASPWHRAGIGRRGERIFDVVAGLVLTLLTTGWVWSIAAARVAGAQSAVTPVTASVTAALTEPAAPSTAFLTEALLDVFTPWRGESGKLRVRLQQPGDPLVSDTLPAGAGVRFSSGAVADTLADTAKMPTAPEAPGVWRLALKLGSVIKPIADLSVITLRPFRDKRNGRIGLYYLGSWPDERRRGSARYTPPSGFIEVTRENQDTYVSEHFRLRDFLTKGQWDVWPKYLVLDMQLVDKLELVLADLASRGHNVSGVRVMSGFRTPHYNARGGKTGGRAALSRHMYGDAADIYIDSDGNGVMDDLNGDGRRDIRDSHVVQAAVDRVERKHPELVGGSGVYSAGSGHGPFIHIDARGYRARWTGSGSD